ncbi:MAG: Na/Pi cotransporter family protein [Bacteroidales bacterium]|nr:Na/Pi cotransporter family protein [Bacteroidales bacterium]
MSIAEIVLKILTLLGALGIFLFGMKLMSESLQKLAGSQLRRLLTLMTYNRYAGILAGFLVTGLVQSSSAITVMLVSFVNGGLLTVKGSIALTLGANIGTTLTAWLVSIFGFTFSIRSLALPLIGISFPLIFSSNNLRRSWGEFILGFSLLFTGLEFMQDIFPVVDNPTERYSYLAELVSPGIWSMLTFVGLGIAITALLQSSSATLTLTTVLAFSGIIPFSHAAAMVLGENIGTTVTANLAATVANAPAQRAARAHLIINLAGVLWMLPLLSFFLTAIDNVFIYLSGVSIHSQTQIIPEESRRLLPMAIASFHSLFNVLNVLLLSFFIPQIAKLSRYLVWKGTKKEELIEHTVNTGLVSIPELSMLEASQKVRRMGALLLKMFNQLRDVFLEKDEQQLLRLTRKVQDKEDSLNTMEVRLQRLLTVLAAEELSNEGSQWVASHRAVADKIRLISAQCLDILRIIEEKRRRKIWFTQEQRTNLNILFLAQSNLLREVAIGLERYEGIDIQAIRKSIAEIRSMANTHINGIQAMKSLVDYRPEAAEVYRELILALARMADTLLPLSDPAIRISRRAPVTDKEGKT